MLCPGHFCAYKLHTDYATPLKAINNDVHTDQHEYVGQAEACAGDSFANN